MPEYTIRAKLDATGVKSGGQATKETLQQVDSAAKRATASVENLSRASTKALGVLGKPLSAGSLFGSLARDAKGLGDSLGAPTKKVQALGDVLTKTRGVLGGNSSVGGLFGNAAKDARGLGAALDKTKASAFNLATVMKKATPAALALAAAAGIKKTVQLASAYQGLENRLRVVITNERERKQTLDQLFAIADRTRTNIDGTVTMYSRLAMSQRELGVTSNELLQFTESLGQAIALSNVSSQSAEAGLRQLSQAMASGTLRGDELNSVMEQLPVVARTIAQGMGVTQGELRKLGAEGKITARDIITAFKVASSTLKDQFGRTVPTVGQRLEQLTNKAIKFFGESGAGKEILAALSEILGVITDNFEEIATVLTLPLRYLGEMVAKFRELYKILRQIGDFEFEDVGDRLARMIIPGYAQGADRAEYLARGAVQSTMLRAGGTGFLAAQAGAEGLLGLERFTQRSGLDWFGDAASNIADRARKGNERRRKEREEAAEKAAKDAAAAAREFAAELDGLLTSLNPITEAEAEYAHSTAILYEALEKYPELVDEIEQAFDKLNAQYKDRLDPFQAIIDRSQKELDLLRLSGPEREKRVRLEELIAEAEKSGVEVTREKADVLRNLVNLEADLVKQEERRQTAIETLKSQTTSSLESISLTTQTVTEGMVDAISTVYDNLANTLSEFAQTGKASFSDMVRSILADLSRLVTSAIFQQLMQMLMSRGQTTNPAMANQIGSLQGAQGILGLANLGAYAGAFASGGSYVVPGSGPPDSRMIMAHVTPGERIDFTPPNQQNRSQGVVVNNVIDYEGIGAVFDSPRFAGAVLNVIRLNPDLLARLR